MRPVGASSRECSTVAAMTTPDVDTSQLMHTAASSRADMWALCAAIISQPTADFVERLRTGSLAAEVRRGTEWLGESFDIKDLVLALERYAAHARACSLEQVLTQLDGEWLRIMADDTLVAICADEEQAARQEAERWHRGDHEGAKVARLAQFHGFEERLRPLAQWCERVDEQARLTLVQVLARLVAAHVTAESGRDVLGRLEQRNATASLRFE